jgi:hypothetical protein
MGKKKAERKPKSKKIRDGFVRYTVYVREIYLQELRKYADKNRIWMTDALDDAITCFINRDE